MRKVKFQTGEYYHIYNRGTDKRDIFMDDKDFIRFLRGMREFNNISTYEQRLFVKNRQNAMEPMELNSKALELSSVIVKPPNHHHFTLRQLTDNGIKIFIGITI